MQVFICKGWEYDGCSDAQIAERRGAGVIQFSFKSKFSWAGRGASTLCIAVVLSVALAGSLGAQEPEDEPEIPEAPAEATPTPVPDPPLDYLEMWEKGEYGLAIKALETQIEKARRLPPRWLLDRAELRFILGNVKGAVADLEQLSAQIADPIYFHRLAVLYRYQGRYAEAKQAMEKGLEQAERFQRWGMSAPNMLAYAQILEETGQDPKTILNSLFPLIHSEYPEFAEGFSGAGDLAFRRGDFQLASEYYEKALAVEPTHLASMAGLAECYWRSNDPRVEEMTEKIAAINPKYQRMMMMKTENLLDLRRVDDAMEVIEAGLQINSADLKFLAYKAAALFLKGDEVGMKAAQGEALQRNKRFAEAYWRVGKVASRHYRFKEAAAFHRKAIETDETDLEAKLQLGFDLLRLGEEKEGQALLEEVYKTDKYNASLFNMLTLMDTLEGYATIERGAFVLKLPRDEEAILAEDALSLLEEELEKYEDLYKVRLERPVLVQIFANHDDFMVRSVGLPGNLGYMGICFGRLVTMDSPSARRKYAMNWRSVLWHEFVHVITLQKTNNKMPRWLSEGISVFEETRRSPAWGQKMDADFKVIVQHEPPPGLSDLEKFFTLPKTSNHLMFGYFCTGEFVKFYVDTYGFDPLVESLEAMANDAKCEEALAAAAKKSVAEIDAAFREHLTKRFEPYKNLPDVALEAEEEFMEEDGDSSDSLQVAGPPDPITAPDPTEAPNDAPFVVALENAAKATQDKRWEDAERELNIAKTYFPEYDGRDAPRRMLINLHKQSEDNEKLKAALLDQLNFVAEDFSACRSYVDLMKEEKIWEEVARVAEWAMGIDPFDVAMRRDLMDALLKTNKDELALAELNRLAHLDPAHATDYRLEQAEAMIRLKQWDGAKKTTLALLEETPHYWRAQELLLRIVERKE